VYFIIGPSSIEVQKEAVRSLPLCILSSDPVQLQTHHDHDHIIKAVSHQQVNCLTLLDISAAFDNLDYSILLERLSSWFGISSNVLSWIKFHLLYRSFCQY